MLCKYLPCIFDKKSLDRTIGFIISFDIPSFSAFLICPPNDDALLRKLYFLKGLFFLTMVLQEQDHVHVPLGAERHCDLLFNHCNSGRCNLSDRDGDPLLLQTLLEADVR